MFNDLLRKRREESQMRQEALAALVGLSRQALSRIELGEQPVERSQVVRLAAALNAPDLLLAYCEECPVCTELLPVRFPSLDNVPTHPAIVAHKLAEECREGAEAAEKLFGTFNLNDWASRPEEIEGVIRLLEQLRDIEVGIRILYDALFLRGVLPLEVLREVSRRQAKKCEAKGYCKPTERSAA